MLDAKTGYVVDGTSVDEVADRVASLLEDPDTALAMGLLHAPGWHETGSGTRSPPDFGALVGILTIKDQSVRTTDSIGRED